LSFLPCFFYFHTFPFHPFILSQNTIKIKNFHRRGKEYFALGAVIR